MTPERKNDWSWLTQAVTPTVLLGVGSAYLLVGSGLKASMPFPDITDFWIPSTRLILQGQPQELFGVRLEIFGHSFPNSYPPLFYFLLAPFVALADSLGLTYSGQSAFGASVVGLPLLLGDLVLSWLLCAGGSHCLPIRDRNWLFAILLVFPVMTFSGIRMQHHESMLLAAVVGSVLLLERGHPAISIALAAIALSLKSTAVLALPALALGLWQRGQRRAALWMLFLPPLAVVVTLLPWLYYRWDATVYSLFWFELQRPIFGVSTAKLFAGTSLEPFIVQWSNPALLFIAALLPLAVGRRGEDIRSQLAQVYLAGLLLSRWVSPHYLLPACGLLVLWESARVSFPRWTVLSVSLLWMLQSPYFPEIDVSVTSGIRVRAGLWGLTLLIMLVSINQRWGAKKSSQTRNIPSGGKRD